MPYTSPRGITVPGVGDAVDSLAQFRRLADSVDAALLSLAGELASDTGWRTITPLNGWAAFIPLQVRAYGPLAAIRGRLTVGPTNSQVAVLPSDCRPVGTEEQTPLRVTSAGQGVQFAISTAGSLDVWSTMGGTPTGMVPIYHVWLRK